MENVEVTETVESTEVVEDTTVDSTEVVDTLNSDDIESIEEIEQEDANAPKLYTVKVNGEDVQVTEEELIGSYQVRKASDAKFQEAAAARKQAEEFIHLLKTDPRKVLTNPTLGLDVRKFAEDFLVEQLQEEMMDPKDRELMQARKQLEEYENEKKRKEQEAQEAEALELRNKYTEEYQTSIVDALSSSGLPKTEHTVKRMAYYMHQGLKRGYNLGAGDVVDLVKQDYINEQKSMYGQLDGDSLVELLGPEVADKIRKHDVSKVTKKRPPTVPQTQPTSKSPREKPSKKITKDDWKAKLERIKNGEE